MGEGPVVADHNGV
jgi:hypothetical protein